MLKNTKWLMYLAICLLAFTLGSRVLADDDHHKKNDDDDKKQEYYDESDHDDEDNQEYEWPTAPVPNQQSEYWYTWSREARNNADNPLPLADAGELTITAGDTKTNLYFIPQEGQLLVSGEALAKAIGAKARYYPQSNICILTKDNHELIVRAGFNAAFENRVKTPMPTNARAYENTVYLPISVAANALGYRILWVNEKIILQAL